MNLQRTVRICWAESDDGQTITIPDGAEILTLEFRDAGGLGYQREISGAWVATTISRQKESSELPPPTA